MSLRSPAKDAANQDGYALLACGADRAVVAVADGAGGMPGGDRASRVALESLREAVAAARAGGGRLREAVLDGVETANERVVELAVGAATTFAAATLEPGPDGRVIARTVHVGDSQVLAWSAAGELLCLTIPHSPVGYALESGMLEEDEAMLHPERHLLTNCIGLPRIHVELNGPLVLSPGDTLLLASDGLWDNLTVQEVAETLGDGTLAAGLDALVAACHERMGSPEEGRPSKPDDLTIVVFRR